VLTFNRAAYNGSRIILRQISPESEAIYDLIIALHNSCNGDWKKLQTGSGISDDDLNHFLDYSTQFLGNLGNYKGFGDSKFIPRLSAEALEKLVSKTDKAKALFDSIGGKTGAIYSGAEKPSIMHLGFPDQGHLSTYYLGTQISQDEIEAISNTMAKNEILPENTRVKKIKDGEYELLVASGISNPPSHDIDAPEGKSSFPIESEKVKGTLTLRFGDHKEEMAKIALEMKKAEHYVANNIEKDMIENYAKSFGSGSLKIFKKSQESWVKDIGPMVETNIGFIETYRDPAGVRGEWEGFGKLLFFRKLRV
jgi:dipeptidyl-peptidase III